MILEHQTVNSKDIQNWKMIKLKNKRVYHGQDPAKDAHVFVFKKLGDPAKDEPRIVKTTLCVTSEAAIAMFSLFVKGEHPE
jgi:hypothetical protein